MQPKLRTVRARVRTIETRAVLPQKKTAAPIYHTAEYRTWREAVLARDGHRCVDPLHDEGLPRAGVTLYADHIHELRDDGAPFDLANGLTRCAPCHSRKTLAARAERIHAPVSDGRAGGAVRPDWIRPSKVPLCMVCGPPGSGKSTYVQRHKGGGDMVIDLDTIASKLSGQPPHAWDRARWLDPALRRRNAMLGSLSGDRLHCSHAWFIVGAPSAEERQWWHDKLRPARIVVLVVSDEVCLARLSADPARIARRGEQSAAVHDWWNRYTPRPADETHTPV